MGSAKKWLFSASISLAFVAGSGCIPANAQVNQIRGWFSEAPDYKGTVEGEGNKNNGASMQINLLHECYANPADCRLGGYPDSSFELVKKVWSVGNTDVTNPLFDIENFKATGGKPGLDLYGNWDEYFKESDGDGDVVEVYGRMVEFKSILNQNTMFSGVKFNCAGDRCVDLMAANPEVDIEFRNSVSNQGNEKDFYISLVNPASIEEIGGGEEGSGGSSCFQEDATGVKVPEAKSCSTNDKKFSGEYTSLKVEDQGKLTLGGNLILEDKFTSFEVRANALVEGSGGLVKTGPQTTVLKGTGTFAYEGDVYVQGGVLDIQNPTALGSVSGETIIKDGASLQLSLTGSKNTNGNYAQIDLNEPLAIDGGTIIFPGNERPSGDSSDDLGSNITLKGPIQILAKGATFKTSIRQINGDGRRRAQISAKVSGEGDFQKSGEGALLISDADFSKFSGDFIISEGLLALGQDNIIPKTSNVDIKQGSKVTMYSQTMNQSIASLTGKGEWEMFYEGQELRIGNDASPNNFEGRITGKGSLVKDGTNTLALSGRNTYTGTTSIENGTLKLGDADSLSETSQITLGSYLSGSGEKGYNPDGFGIFDLNALDISTKSLEVKNGSLQGGGKLTVREKMPGTTHHSQFTLGESTELILLQGGRIDPKISLNGLISVKGGNLTLMNSQADGEGSISIDSGATLQVSNNSGYRGLLNKWDVKNNGTLLFQKAPSQDVTGDISGAGNVIIKAAYEQTDRIITFSGKNTYTGNTTVNGGTLLAGADGTFSNASELIANEGGVIDLGGLNQSVGKISIKGGELKNGFLSGGTVEVFGTGFIDGVGAVAEESESESESKSETDPEVEAIVISPGSASLIANGLKSGGYLTLTGDNHFQDLKLENGKVLLGSLNKGTSKSGSLVLDGGVTGSAFRDAFVLQGALTLNEKQTIDLGGGDDLFFIGAKGSLIAAPLVEVEVEAEVDPAEADAEAEKEEIKKLKITIDGGAGDMDIFWDASGNYYALTESADGLFTESEDSQLAGNVKNFELVGVAGQGIAYFGTTPSFATVQAEASPPPGEYGLMLGSVGKDKSLIGGVDQKLTINSGYDSGTRDSLITKVGGIALGKGDATIVVPGGTLEAGIIYGGGAKSTIELGSSFTGEVKLGALSSVAKGRLDVGVLYGYDTINQLGGLWSYNGRMDDTNLLAQGVVRVEADDSATLKSITARERRQKINTPLGINGRSIIAVSGALTIGEGGIQEQGSARASLLVASRDGADAHVDLYGKSNYSGPTIVARGGSLHAHTDNALSSVSKTLVGNLGSINIEGSQEINRLLIRKNGKFIGGGDSKLTTKSIVNRGEISLDSIVIEDGMTRFLDRYVKLKSLKGEPAPIAERLRNIDAQGSLKNIGGSINLDGDLKFISSGDAGGHALLNLTTGSRGFLPPSEATLSAYSIQFSDKNDVLINSGSVETTGALGINFGLGNDLVLTKGTFSIESGSKIDGGEPLDTSNWKPGNRSITGLNIFKAYENPGVVESDLVNWAAIKLGSDQDWLFPQGGECRVTGDGRTFTQDTLCVGLTGTRQNQSVIIDGPKGRQPTVDAGVIALGRGSSNTIEVRNGNLHAILIEGSPGQTKGATNDRLFLGDGSGGSGELIVGAITGFDSMEQRGGTWSYAVNGVDDPQVKDRLITSGRRTAEELDEMGSFPAFTGYGIAKIAPVVITGGRDGKQRTVQRAAFARIEGTNPELPLQVQNIDSELEVAEGIFGNASLSTSGNTLLNGESRYTGPTTIQSGGELKAGNSLALSPSSEITIEPGGVLDLDGYDNKILGLSGGSRFVSDPGIVKLGTVCPDNEANSCTADLPGGVLSVSRGNFDGVIEDVLDSSGALIKDGSLNDILTLGGSNQYSSPTLIRGGVLKASADQALSPNSPYSLIGGELDLRGHQQVLPSVNIYGGVLRVESDNPVSVAGNVNFADGRIVAYLNNGTAADGANAPISAQSFNYIPLSQKRDLNHGIYAIVDPAGTSNPELNGTWKVIAGEVNDIDALARKTFLIFPVTDGQEVDPDQVIEVDGVLYSVANFAGLNVPLDAAALKTVVLEKGSLNIVVKDKTKDEIIDDIKADQTDKFGCEGLEELCDGLAEPEVVDLLDLVLPVAGESGLAEKLPVLQWGQLAKLLGSGLTPRNVDAAPRGMQTYNNVLADTVFERHPLRQYQKLEEKSEIIANDLSSVKDSSAVDQDLLDPAAVNVITFDGNQYVEIPSLTAQYAERDGVRGWFRGFGANNRSYSSTTLNNDYSLYTGGFAIGADVSFGESFQLGAYANYGDVNVVQGGVTGGGFWNPDGWGGGVSADYWTENFYVQGLLGATGYSASQSRGITNLDKEWGGDTATANKTANSYVGALRIGAPFESGSLLLEPQFTGIWTQNHENSFSESGVRDGLRLRYGSRTTNYLQTGLGMKFAWPIGSGGRNQLVPSLKVAWLADWDLGSDGQSIGYKFTDREVVFQPKQETQNGALIEVGLDYSIANINKMSVKLYASGGAELWGDDRGTTWRGSGGVTFQF